MNPWVGMWEARAVVRRVVSAWVKGLGGVGWVVEW